MMARPENVRKMLSLLFKYMLLNSVIERNERWMRKTKGRNLFTNSLHCSFYPLYKITFCYLQSFINVTFLYSCTQSKQEAMKQCRRRISQPT